MLSDDNGDRPGALLGDELLDLRSAFGCLHVDSLLPPSLTGILVVGEECLAAIDRMVKGLLDGPESVRVQLRDCNALVPYDQDHVDAPFPGTGLIVCSGHTYAAHAQEMKSSRPEHMAGFIKNSNAVVGTGKPIVLPARHPDMVDFEGEFCVVIGRPCHDVSADEAQDYVAGYLLINDISARDWVAEARATGNMFFNELGKQFPTFCPMGPCLVTADEIIDANDVHFKTMVNEVVMQSASTRDLSFSISEIVSFWSRWYRFQPGDVITTGSPPGVGAGRNPPVYLKPGDRVTVESEGFGYLSNPVVSSSQK
jgi:2-keto-4-pentenoate hydratase/2-oxohepta-3-ene-1,7-dioic acid hydratase in catechol pathway